MKSTTIKSLLTVKKAGGQGTGLLVTTKIPGTRIDLIGASCLATLDRDSASLTLAPIRFRETIALTITPPANGAPAKPMRVALQAGQDTLSKPFLNLDHPLFATSNGDQIRLSEDGLLVITAAGEKFISPDSGLSPNDAAKLRSGCAAGKAWIASGETLCQYLAGRMTIDQLKTAAEALAVAEALPAKYARLEADYADLDRLHTTAVISLEDRTAELRDQTTLLQSARDVIADITKVLARKTGWKHCLPGLTSYLRAKEIGRIIKWHSGDKQ